MTLRGLGLVGLTVVFAVGLAACSSLVPAGGPSTGEPAAPSPYASPNLAELVVAFDVPVSLQPAEDQPSLFAYDVTPPGQGARRVEANLTFAAVDVSDSLQPPANERTYFLYALADADKAALREAQAAAGAAASAAITVSPRFCAVGPIDPAKATISALLIVPGQASPQTLIASQPIATLLAASGTELQACD